MRTMLVVIGVLFFSPVDLAAAAGLNFGCAGGTCNCHGTKDCSTMIDKNKCTGPLECDVVNPQFCHCSAKLTAPKVGKNITSGIVNGGKKNVAQ